MSHSTSRSKFKLSKKYLKIRKPYILHTGSQSFILCVWLSFRCLYYHLSIAIRFILIFTYQIAFLLTMVLYTSISNNRNPHAKQPGFVGSFCIFTVELLKARTGSKTIDAARNIIENRSFKSILLTDAHIVMYSLIWQPFRYHNQNRGP